MGRSQRPRPRRLAEKLKAIRLSLDLSQAKMVKRLDYSESYLVASHISEFENGKREPALPLLLTYARVANVSVESLIDDKIDLPDEF